MGRKKRKGSFREIVATYKTGEKLANAAMKRVDRLAKKHKIGAK